LFNAKIMVCVKLIGGLGNQMFQYAVARCLAVQKRTRLKLDVSGLDGVSSDSNAPKRSYALSCFSIQGAIATRDDMNHFFPEMRLARYWTKLRRRLFPYQWQGYLKERREFAFDPHVLRAIGSTYLDGYWQNENYFREVTTELRQDFQLARPLAAPSQELLEVISRTNAVSVHVRRGDYVSNARTHAHHGVCPREYYHRAAKLALDSLGVAHFFVFSDDSSWPRENLNWEHPTTYLNGTVSREPYEDMILMSRCRHNIIANSTFSWWAAWLNDNPHKLVIAPRKWLGARPDAAELVLPEAWQRI
jgi:Glycosyl transferase family 11